MEVPKALPIDFQDDSYYDEQEKEALSYLMKVREEQNSTSNVIRSSKNYGQSSQLLPGQNQNEIGQVKASSGLSEGRSSKQEAENLVSDITMSNLLCLRNIALPWRLHYAEKQESSDQQDIYEDQDIIMRKENTFSKIQDHPWNKEWYEAVIKEAAQLQAETKIVQHSLQKDALYQDCEEFYEFIDGLFKNKQTISQNEIALASEVVLQDFVGYLIREKEEEWDNLPGPIPLIELQMIYGIICQLQQPLLREQAADLNDLVNVLLKQKEFLADLEQNKENLRSLAAIDINLALISSIIVLKG